MNKTLTILNAKPRGVSGSMPVVTIGLALFLTGLCFGPSAATAATIDTPSGVDRPEENPVVHLGFDGDVETGRDGDKVVASDRSSFVAGRKGKAVRL